MQCLMPPMVNRSKVRLVPFVIFDDSIEHRPGKRDKKELVKMVSADEKDLGHVKYRTGRVLRTTGV